MTAAKKAAASKPEGDEAEGNLSGHVVTGARIQVTVGGQVLQFAQGDVLPEGVDKASLKRLVDRDLVDKK